MVSASTRCWIRPCRMGHLGSSMALALNQAIFKATSPLSRATCGKRLEIFSEHLARRAKKVQHGRESPAWTTLPKLLRPSKGITCRGLAQIWKRGEQRDDFRKMPMIGNILIPLSHNF